MLISLTSRPISELHDDIHTATLLQRAARFEYRSYTETLSNTIKAATSLVLAKSTLQYTVCITDPYQTERFPLDINTLDYTSRGDWRWVTKLCFEHQGSSFMNLTCEKKLIDLPYVSSQLSAHWLLRNFNQEILALLSRRRSS